MDALTQTLAIVFAVISLVVLLLAYRNPIPRKIGFRNVKRRIANTILVIIGSMVGTALISGSLVLSDSLDATFYKLVEEQVGEVDALISPKLKEQTQSPVAAFTIAEYEEIANLIDEKTDGILPVLEFQTSPIKLDSESKPIINDYQVSLYAIEIEDLNKFGQSPQILENFNTPDSIYISQSAANQLEAQTGDIIRVNLLGKSIELKIQKILEDQGIWGGKTILANYTFITDELEIADIGYNLIAISSIGGISPEDYVGEDFKSQITSNLSKYRSEQNSIVVNEVKQIALEG